MLSPTDGTNTTPPAITHGLLYHEEMFDLLRSIVQASKCGVYDRRTLLAGCNTRRYRLESRAGWNGRALDRSGWLTMLQTANYLERAAKSDDIVCFPRLTLGPLQ